MIKKRIIAIITGLAVAAMIVVPAPAQAITAAELQVQINALLAQLQLLQTQLGDLGGGTPGGTVSGCTITSFTVNLKVGDSGASVKCLQIVLNSATDTQLSSGVGSPGQETSYFGPKTKTAVIKFQEKYTAAILAVYGLTSGTGYVGTTTRAQLDTMLGGIVVTPPDNGDTVIPPVTGTGLSVSIASDSPVSGTVVSRQGLATLIKLVFTNGDSAEAKVTGINLTRIGVSADAILINVYAFEGADRLTDAASVSSGTVNLNDSAGIFTVPAGGSVVISIKADIGGSAGETVGVSIGASTAVTSTATSVNGVFPLTGNLMSRATASVALVSFSSNTTPGTNTGLAPQDNVTVWQNQVTFNTRAVDFTRISFRKIGGVANADIINFRLYVGGIQVGSTVASLDENGYVTFDLSASPKRIEAGARIIKLVADVIGGSSLDFYFSIRNSADANFTDTQYNVGVMPTTDNSTTVFTVSHVTAGTQTVSSGTLTVTKTTDSPSGNTVNGAPNITIARYELKAAGEAVKIETLYAAVLCSAGGQTASSDVGYLRNGMLLANGVQIGSTKDLYCTAYSTTYQTFPLGSSLIVQPGSPVTLEIRADFYDGDGTDNMTANDTIVGRLVAASGNAMGLVSSSSVSVPTTVKAGNTLTVKEGTLTLSKYTAYTDQAAVAPLNDYKLAHFTLSADTTEAVNLNTITVTLNEVSGSANDLYIKYGTQETNHIATATLTNTFYINYQLVAGQTIDLEVYTDVATGVDSGNGIATVAVAGTTADSATSVTGGGLAGQTITFTTGSFATAVGAGMPLNQLVTGSQQIVAGKFKFTAANDDYTIREVRIALDATDGITGAVPSSVIVNAVLKDGETVLGTMPFANTTIGANDTATFIGLSVPVPANTSKTLTVELVVSQPSSTVSTSQINAYVTMTHVEFANSQGTIETDTDDRDGNELYVFKSIPVVTKGTVTKTTLGVGTDIDLYKWTVSSQGTGSGSIAISQMKFGLTWADTDDSMIELEYMTLWKGTSNITTLVTIYDEDANALTDAFGATTEAEYIIITFDTEDVIADGSTATYTLKAIAQGFVAKTNTAADDKVTVRLLNDSSVNGVKYLEEVANVLRLVDSADANPETANFIWSDNSAVSHSTTSADSSGDWSNGYLVQSLPLGSEQWVGP